MAFITTAVYKKLIGSEVNHTTKVPYELYQELDYHFGISQVLSQYELGLLGEHIRICSRDYEDEIKKLFLHPKEDHFLYVFETIGAYKYHLFDDCIYLNNDFNNYVVPEEVRERGVDLVSQYRNWFVGNGFDKIQGNEKDIVSKITFSYNTSFAPINELTPLNENYKLIVSLKNSTYKNSEKYYSLVNIQSKIKEYSRKYKIQFSNKTILNLMRYSHYVSFSKVNIESKVAELTSDVFLKNYGFDKLIREFNEANRIKYVIIEELKLYINFRCGFKSNDLSKEVLESYGLICCKSCYERGFTDSNKG